MTVTRTGFEKFTRTNIVVNVAQTLEENAVLTVGSESQTITVAANALQVQTETSEVSTLISGRAGRAALNQRPQHGAACGAGLGVSNNLPSFGGIDALTSSSGISFNGTRKTHNVYLLDGAELNDRGCGGCYMVLPSQDSIAEFQTLGQQLQPRLRHRLGRNDHDGLEVGHKRSFTESCTSTTATPIYNANDYFNKQAGRTTAGIHVE